MTNPCERCGKTMADEAEAYNHGDLACIDYLREKLAEYENDETPRRRQDAYRIRTLELEVCTCPWPADAAKTRHLLSCRLMQMEHEAARKVNP